MRAELGLVRARLSREKAMQVADYGDLRSDFPQRRGHLARVHETVTPGEAGRAHADGARQEREIVRDPVVDRGQRDVVVGESKEPPGYFRPPDLGMEKQMVGHDEARLTPIARLLN